MPILEIWISYTCQKMVIFKDIITICSWKHMLICIRRHDNVRKNSISCRIVALTKLRITTFDVALKFGAHFQSNIYSLYCIITYSLFIIATYRKIYLPSLLCIFNSIRSWTIIIHSHIFCDKCSNIDCCLWNSNLLRFSCTYYHIFLLNHRHPI